MINSAKTIMKHEEVWVYLYKNLWNDLIVWSGTVGARYNLRSALFNVPKDISIDRVSDFLLGDKFDKMIKLFPILLNNECWEKHIVKGNLIFKNKGLYSSARFYLYRTFKNYLIDLHRRERKESLYSEEQALNQRIEAEQHLTYVFNEYLNGLTEQEDKIIVYSFLNLSDDEEPWKILNISRRTYFRKKNFHKENIMELIKNKGG